MLVVNLSLLLLTLLSAVFGTLAYVSHGISPKNGT